MKKITNIFAITAAVLLTGCAHQATDMRVSSTEEKITALESRALQIEERLAVVEQIPREPRQRIDTTRYCIAGNLAFTEGAIHNQRLCKRAEGLTIFRDGVGQTPPLVWTDWRQAR